MQIKKFEHKVWLASPYMHGDEQRFVNEAFDSNWVSTVGENLNQLEKELCQYVDCHASVALSSGTAALHLAVKLAGVQQGDVVLCSDLTFAATVNPVSYERGIPVFIDSERDTWNMDPRALEMALEKYRGKVKAVIAVNLYGTPAKLDEIAALCDNYNVVFIEDAAESLSATYKSRQTGTFGTYGVLSFNGNKIITASGGGMLLSDHGEAVEKARFWATQAREQAPWYQHSELGYNYRLSNVLAGIGRGQLLHLEEHSVGKRAIYERYKTELADLPITMNPYLDCSEPNFWLSCMLIDKKLAARGKVTPDKIRMMLADYNVECRPIWKPMHMQPYYANQKYVSITDHNAGEDIFARGICLPSDLNMTEEQQHIVIALIKRCFSIR